MLSVLAPALSAIRNPSPVLVGGAPLARCAAGWYRARSSRSQSKPPVASITAGAPIVLTPPACQTVADPGRAPVSRAPATTCTPAFTTPSSSPATSAIPPVLTPFRSRSCSSSQSNRSG